MQPIPDKNFRSEEGFSLLEVLIAMAIFFIGMLAVASMQIASLNGTSEAYEYTEATTWVEDQVEKLMMLSFNDSQLDLNPDGNNPTKPPPDDPINDTIYDVGWTVTASTTDDSGLPLSKRVELWVTWPKDAGASAQKEFRVSFVVNDPQ